MTTLDSSPSAVIQPIGHPHAIGYTGKRLLDVVAAAIVLVAAAPVMVLIAVGIKMTSRGPVLFRQRRLGLREQPFMILKFRSMRADASRTGPAFTTANDRRITWLGAILRRTSLDELPQLLNVLRGDMSLLGPRPYAGFELAEWSAEQRAMRASVRPGISGLAQANGRSANTADAARHYDLEYVRTCHFQLDCRILWQTVLTVVAIRGTN